MKIYIPPQIKRLFFFLTIFIFLFILFRRLVIPDTFGDLGHYRAASLDDFKAQETKFASKELCAECHDDIAASLASDLHKGLSCETCHGAGMQHVQDPESLEMGISSDRAFCGLCHGIIPARNKNVVLQVDLAEHNTDINCIECHNPHMPWESIK